MMKARIESIESGIATIKTNDDQTLKIQCSSIHGTPKIGDELRLILSTATADQNDTQDLARAILNELIG